MRVLEFEAEKPAEQAEHWRQRQPERGPVRIIWGGLLIILAVLYLASRRPSLRFEPAQLYLGTMTIGLEHSERVRVLNTGGAALTIRDVAPADATGPFSVKETDCRRQLLPRDECSITVRFQPKVAGSYDGGIVLRAEDSAVPQQLAVSGGAIPVIDGRLVVSTNLLDFRTQNLGESSSAVVSARNDGEGPLRVSTATRGNTAQFTVRDECTGHELYGGSTCNLDITFSPSSAGPAEFQVFISDNNHKVEMVSVRGIGKPVTSPPPPPPQALLPKADVTPSSLAFDVQRAHLDNQSRFTTIRNSGNAPLVLRDAVLSGAGYTVVSDSCSRRSLAPRADCSITVRFAPPQPGTFRGSIVIATNAPSGAVNVTMSGVAIAPGRLTVSPQTLDFGSFQLGPKSRPFAKNVTLENTGGGALNLQQPELQSSDGAFSLGDGNCPQQLAPGTTCELSLNFRPASAGPAYGSLVLRAEGDKPQQVSLTGTATAPPPRARMFPSELNFGTVYLRQRTALTATLQNVSGSDLSITGITVESQDRDFNISRNGCGQQLPARTSCSIEVTFSPRRYGERIATLVVASDSAVAVQPVNLTGVGQRRQVVGPPIESDANDTGTNGPKRPTSGDNNAKTTPSPATCWQPSAARIDFQLLTRTPSGGHFRVVGVVANHGNGSTGPAPALIQLREGHPTLDNALVVKEERITSISRPVSVTYETDFSTSNEFPPTYFLSVTFTGSKRLAMVAPVGGCNPRPSSLERNGGDMRKILDNAPKHIDVGKLPPKFQIPK